MTRSIKLILLFGMTIILASCSSADVNYEPSDYYDAEEGGAEETPDYDTGDTDLSAGGDVLQADTPTLPTRKIIYEADIALLSEDINQTYDSILTTMNSYTAYVEAENINNQKIDVVIRVLSTEFDDLIGELKTSGELLNYTKTSDDITNVYSTYQARLDALNSQHARLLVLMDQATELDDILSIEAQLVDIEAELNEIGQTLATYDSLVDYSTINLSIDYIYDLASLLPESEKPNITIVDTTTDTIVMDVYNKSERDSTLYINVLDNGEIIQQYERESLGESTERFNIGDLDSGTTYRIEVSALESGSVRSDERVEIEKTLPTFGSTVSNTFNASLNSMVRLGKGLVLVFTALLPYLVVGTVIFIPVYKFIIKPRRIKGKEMRDEIRHTLKQQSKNKETDK